MNQPQVTLNQQTDILGEQEMTPTARAVRNAIREKVIHDEDGREIRLRKPGVLDQLHLIEFLEHRSTNPVYFHLASAVIWVCGIDGEAIHMPTSILELEAIFQQLDEHGVNVVAKAVAEISGANDAEKDKQQIKK